eukprot:COSAG06_NODE_39774_length_409_cov_0.509677_1_plen_47_part_10
MYNVIYIYIIPHGTNSLMFLHTTSFVHPQPVLANNEVSKFKNAVGVS